MDLEDIVYLLGKKVRIVDTDDIVHIGYFMDYTPAFNNPEDEWDIEIYPTKSSNSGWGFFESDIKSIEEIN